MNGDNVADFDGAGRMIAWVDTFGDLHAVVNNGDSAGSHACQHDRRRVDAVINVHLKGTFAPAKHACGYWRDRSKAVMRSSAESLIRRRCRVFTQPWPDNYGAAKAGIAAFTVISALEMERYGVTWLPPSINRMTENLGPAPETSKRPNGRHVGLPDRNLVGLGGVKWGDGSRI